MKAGIIFTGTGPILILTTYESLEDPNLVTKFAAKGIRKFIASELPLKNKPYLSPTSPDRRRQDEGPKELWF